MKRIVEETLRTGIKQYRVESNRILWIVPWKWHTITFVSNIWGDKVLAIFSDVNKARQVLKNGKVDSPTDIVERKIITEN